VAEPAIHAVEVDPLRVPLRRPWGADVTEVHVTVVTVTASDGARGTGFSWTPTIGGEAVTALLRHDIAPFVTGLPAGPEIWQQVWERLHEAGGGGLTTIAAAGLDLALWDLRARRRGLPIADLLGRRHARQPVYGSGVNLHYSLEELVAQVRRWVAAGCRGVKVKIGKPDLEEDLDRLTAVREALGPDRELMVDANQRWDLERALRAVGELERFDLRWLEEPLRSEDTPGYVTLRKATAIPLAMGENVHTWYRFRDLVDAGAVDVLQPNVIRVGGITPFLRIANLVREAGLHLAPHLLPELSGQLALTLPAQTWVEDVEDAGFSDLGALSEPTGCRIEDGWFTAGNRPGLGFSFRGQVAA
jgi:L-alanine-DL-glutamate epimerase-like enolase superfamily enzyme